MEIPLEYKTVIAVKSCADPNAGIIGLQAARERKGPPAGLND